jgi:hypothetical protein
VPGGAEKLADGRNTLDIDHSAKVLKSVVAGLLIDYCNVLIARHCAVLIALF